MATLAATPTPGGGGVSISITTQGFEAVFAVLDKLSMPLWEILLRRLATTLESQVDRHFAAGAGAEGAWAPTQRGGTILVLTGRLRGSIKAEVGNMQVAVGAGMPYGVFHEFGTVKMPRRAFLGPTEADIVELSDVVEDFIEGLTRG